MLIVYSRNYEHVLRHGVLRRLGRGKCYPCLRTCVTHVSGPYKQAGEGIFSVQNLGLGSASSGIKPGVAVQRDKHGAFQQKAGHGPTFFLIYEEPSGGVFRHFPLFLFLMLTVVVTQGVFGATSRAESGDAFQVTDNAGAVVNVM